MRPGGVHICLFQPEIPQNAGNIARLAAATQSRLHLVRPFGFGTADKNLRRPGLDYWPYLDLEIHDSLAAVLEASAAPPALLSARATAPYTAIPEQTDLIIFGKETSGLPQEVRDAFSAQLFRIPIASPGVRSLNVANAVAIVVYDLLRRRGLLDELPGGDG